MTPFVNYLHSAALPDSFSSSYFYGRHLQAIVDGTNGHDEEVFLFSRGEITDSPYSGAIIIFLTPPS
jgi:hypothetical protein